MKFQKPKRRTRRPAKRLKQVTNPGKEHSKIVRECLCLMGKIDAAQAELRRFKSEDCNPFRQWRDMHLGDLLSRFAQRCKEFAPHDPGWHEILETLQLKALAERLEDCMRKCSSNPNGQEFGKQDYRVLVRRLHPDSNREGGPLALELWHELQRANERGDVKRLELLLALTAGIDGQVVGTSELKVTKTVRSNLRHQSKSCAGLLRAAEKSLAWNFSRKTDRSLMLENCRLALMTAIADLEQRQYQYMDAFYYTPGYRFMAG